MDKKVYEFIFAQKGDVVMFAGKGHETVQLTNLGRRKWSDMEEIEGNF